MPVDTDQSTVVSEVQLSMIKDATGSSQCFSRLEPVIAAGLEDVDADALKNEIRKWAKVVIAYAHQLSLDAVKEGLIIE